LADKNIEREALKANKQVDTGMLIFQAKNLENETVALGENTTD